MTTPETSASRVQRRRDKMRAAGLRPVQIWVPDTRAPGFAEECRRQAALLSRPENIDADHEAWLDKLTEENFAALDRDGW